MFFNDNNVLIIAEAGSNWKMGSPEKDLQTAKALIDVAVEAKADVCKFQTYSKDCNYVLNAGVSDYLAGVGIKKSINDLINELAMPREMISQLANYCQEKGIVFMSTPFSLQDMQDLDPYVKMHKIGSYEITTPELFEFAAKTGKPLIFSSGASTLEDIEWAVNYFKEQGGRDLALMHCIGKYPAPLNILNLKTITFLQKHFNLPIGYSDHSREPIIGPIAAVALGSKIIEKHFTLSNKLPGPDHNFSLEPQDLKDMVKAIRETEICLGKEEKILQPAEKELYVFAQRAVQAIKDIKIGERFVLGENIAVLRPGKQTKGVHPRLLPEIEGKQAKRDIPVGYGIQTSDYA